LWRIPYSLVNGLLSIVHTLPGPPLLQMVVMMVDMDACDHVSVGSGFIRGEIKLFYHSPTIF
jgi:hypothetical protein